MEHLIELKDVYKIYHMGDEDVHALDGVSLTIDKGEFVAIVGQSGSGKSTAMNIIGCLDVPTSGTYHLGGVDVSTMDDDQQAEIRNKMLGFIFQQYNLIPKLTVLENVELPLLYAGVGAEERKERAVAALGRVGLAEKQKNLPSQLSGGQQQRVSIARALAGNPSVILADEPTGALDSRTGREVLGFLQKLNQEGDTVVLITHDNSIAVKADRIIRDFQPDVILGTGGYASYPMLHEGARLGIPTAVHESNAVPGLATKMVADKVDRILVSFADSRSAYRDPSRVIAVGMPVREEFVFTRRADARRALGLDEKTPMIVSAWGSLGAREMNKKIAQFMKLECEQDCWRHIHATGSFGWRWMPDYVKEQGVELEKHPLITMQEYIYNMPELMAAADVVISRAGASTLNEIAAAGTPCIIVPSPNVTNDHQEKNARILEQHGAAVVLHENHCDGELLFRTTQELLADAPRRASMRKALQELAVVDSASRICDIILNLAKTHKS